jgi:uncharacterized membrane protein YfcA
MATELLFPLAVAILAVALLYSSVGQAGATGYIAVMTLFSLALADIKPVTLVLNTLVAAIATYQFGRAGHFSRALFWPFAVTSVPMAFVGGYLNLPPRAFQLLVGAMLLLAAALLFVRPPPNQDPQPPRVPTALGIGAVLGLLAGLTASGGGVLLTPLLLFMHWASARAAAAVSAPFILLNSLAAVGGVAKSTATMPAIALPLAVAAVAGGLLGSSFGARRLPARATRRLLATVLVIAGAKLVSP